MRAKIRSKDLELIKNKIEKTVDESMTAEAVGSGELKVLATPAMIALIEETCWKSVAGMFGEGKGTVGTRMDVRHLAATPVGMKIWCESELTEDDGKRILFTVKAYDEKGLIGEGTHERYVVENEVFLARANAKLDD